MSVTKYKTEIENFYLFVSHKTDGQEVATYGLVSDDNKKMVEIIPKYGPLTFVNSEEDVMKDYLSCDYDRGNWSQLHFDENNVNKMLNEGKFKELAEFLKTCL